MGKPGRPKGSRNKQRLPVEAHATRCPVCYSTDIVDRRFRARSYCPGHINGLPHTHITVYSAKCRQCGTDLRVNEAEYILSRPKPKNAVL